MYVLFVLSMLLSNGVCYQCNQCHCIDWMDTMICSGQHITHFPLMYDSSWISHIDLLNTSITQIPSLNVDQWGNLLTVDIRDNLLLSCTDVITFQNERPDLLILTDCDDDIHTNNFKYDFLYLLLLVPVVFVILLIYMCKQVINVTNIVVLFGCI